MIYATTKLYTIILFIYMINIAHAFNIKEMLFGNKETVNDQPAVFFGQPIVERQQPSRAGKKKYPHCSKNNVKCSI